MREYLEVLQRPELTSRFSALKGIDVARVLAIVREATVVMPEPEPQVSRDVIDNKFLAAAEAAKAPYLVSEDNDLLDLEEHLDTRIIPTLEFLRYLNKDRRAA